MRGSRRSSFMAQGLRPQPDTTRASRRRARQICSTGAAASRGERNAIHRIPWFRVRHCIGRRELQQSYDTHIHARARSPPCNRPRTKRSPFGERARKTEDRDWHVGPRVGEAALCGVTRDSLRSLARGTCNNLARITGGRRSRQLGPACQRYRAYA